MATVSPLPRTTSMTLASPSAGPFDVGFRLFEADALKVWVDSEVSTGFTVDATFVNGYDDDAQITFEATLATSTVIVIDGNMIPARDDDYLNGPGLVSLMNIELARAWATLSELKMRLDRAALGPTPALTLEDVQGIVAAAGSVPAPTGGQTGYLMQATGAGAYDWISRAVALGAALEAVRTLTPAADRMPYFTGVSGAALATLTAFARTLLDDADATTMRATLGLAIGTHVQAFNSKLSELAAPAYVRGDIILRGASTLDRLGLGAARTVLGSNGTDALWQDRDTTVGLLTTTGAAIVGPWALPAGIKKFRVTARNVALSGTGNALVQLSTGAAFVTTGYDSRAGGGAPPPPLQRQQLDRDYRVARRQRGLLVRAHGLYAARSRDKPVGGSAYSGSVRRLQYRPDLRSRVHCTGRGD